MAKSIGISKGTLFSISEFSITETEIPYVQSLLYSWVKITLSEANFIQKQLVCDSLDLFKTQVAIQVLFG